MDLRNWVNGIGIGIKIGGPSPGHEETFIVLWYQITLNIKFTYSFREAGKGGLMQKAQFRPQLLKYPIDIYPH